MNIPLKPADNGLYRTPTQIDLLRTDAPATGLDWCEADLRRVRGKRGLLAALARSLRFPETFGGNWDALADALQDLSWLEGGVLCHLRGYDRFREAAPADAQVLEEILAESAQFWRGRQRVFVVLTEGTGATLPRRL